MKDATDIKGNAALEGDWQLFHFDPVTGIRVETLDLGTHLAVRRVFTPIEELKDLNHDRRMDNMNKRWGDGAVAASIPLPLYYERFAEARQNGDSKYIKKLLNDPDYKYLRTKEGKL